MKEPPFFIVGHERSGTTLLAAAFDRHSRVAVPPETHFFTDVCPARQAHRRADCAFMVNHLFRGNRIRDLNLSPQELFHRIEGAHPTWSQLFVEVLRLYAESRGKTRVGEKTPNHWRVVPQLLDLFPGSRAIWVVRDARDTVLSLMKVPWKRHSNLALHGVQWRITTERMLACESQFAGRILRVKFEDLVTTPQAQLERACRFIGINFEPQQLDPSTKTEAIPQWELPWKSRVLCPPDPSRIGTAARELPEKSMRLLNSIVGACMRQLQYELVKA